MPDQQEARSREPRRRSRPTGGRCVVVTKWQLPPQLAVGPFDSFNDAIDWANKTREEGIALPEFDMLTLVDQHETADIDWG